MCNLVAEAASLVAPAAIADAVAIVAAVVTAAAVVNVHSCEKSHHPLVAVAQCHLSLLSDAVG